jgi:hypothetical protein
MNRKKCRFALCTLVLFAPLSVVAQITPQTPPPARDNAVHALWLEWQTIASNISRSAELMPDSSYSYRPVQTVMSFGDMLAHVSTTRYARETLDLASIPISTHVGQGSSLAVHTLELSHTRKPWLQPALVFSPSFLPLHSHR